MNQEQELAVLTELTRMPRTVVVVDMVESVRLIERYEEPTIRRWRTFVDEAVRLDAQPLGGRLVKSLGDGMMLEFMEPRPAVQCALAMQARLAKLNEPLSADERMDARIGIHAADVIVEQEDIYGAGVNLAARVATLAGPGEIVVTPAVRDQVVDGLDAQTEDLGECYFKHVALPVRTYRIGAAGARPVVEGRGGTSTQDLPTIAVIPFDGRAAPADLHAVGDLIADGVISALSSSAHLHVISRLSCAAFRRRDYGLSDVRKHLDATYVLSGTYYGSSGRLTLAAELADARDGCVIWAERLNASIHDLLDAESDVLNRLAEAVNRAVLHIEVKRAQSMPMPSLESFSLLLGAISMMHRQSASGFERAKQLLDYLRDRHPRKSVPLVWLAKWHVLRVVQGWSPSPAEEGDHALEVAKRALDLQPDSSLAITMTGLVHAYLRKDFDAASAKYREALTENPNESLAWLFLGTMHAFKGEGDPAADATERALTLSPLDPLRYFYDSLAASAAISAGRYDRAIELANRSLMANLGHTSTYRALAIAQSLSGRVSEARATIQTLLTLEPGFTVRAFEERYPGRAYVPEYTALLANSLRVAGLPN
ncbi:MAG: adenylate/guanylate cyclase domain-containing protein [Burkholderiaceae bacterium]